MLAVKNFNAFFRSPPTCEHMRARVVEILRLFAEHLRRGRGWPPYLVRVGTRFNEAVRIIYDAAHDTPPWNDDLVGRVCDVVLEAQDVDISLYGAHTRDRFDVAHALAVMAGTISVDQFDFDARQSLQKKLDDAVAKTYERKGKKQEVSDDLGRKIVTFIIPRGVFDVASLQHTPENNMSFTPASELHHDARPPKADTLARVFLDALRHGTVTCTYIQRREYRVQAALALSWCIDRFGDLSNGNPPKDWADGKNLSALEQLERLRAIAGDKGIQTRIELNQPGG
jgi:hypothetical protein